MNASNATRSSSLHSDATVRQSAGWHSQELGRRAGDLLRAGAFVGRERFGWLERQKVEPAKQVVDLFKRHQMMRVERRGSVKQESLEWTGIDGDLLAGLKGGHATRIVAQQTGALPRFADKRRVNSR